MYYEKPEIDIFIFDSDVVTGSPILENDPFGGGVDDGDIDYDADGE